MKIDEAAELLESLDQRLNVYAGVSVDLYPHYLVAGAIVLGFGLLATELRAIRVHIDNAIAEEKRGR